MVNAGAASTTQSTVVAAPTNVSVLFGPASTITIQLKDAFGNDLTTGGHAVTVELNAASTGNGSLSAVTDNGDGTYTATFNASSTGNAIINARLSGILLSSSATITIGL
jgi:adhesin/invasin